MFAVSDTHSHFKHISMTGKKFTIGLDFGTNSVRAVIVDVENGHEVATATHAYSRGDNGVIGSPTNPHVARQHPADYHEGIAGSILSVLQRAKNVAGFASENVIGIGVATTGSTPIPVDENGLALGMHPNFGNNPDAYAWLWKDHSAMAEAEEITALAREHRPEYLERCGGTYSSEWFYAKMLHCRRTAPNVFAATHTWVELCDYIPAVLMGVQSANEIVRGLCAAGHKAMFASDWGGLPDTEFLAMLDPDIAALRPRLYDEAFSSAHCAGVLSLEWAKKLDLSEGIAIAVGAFDVHHGAVGAGVGPGVLVKAIGTSTCDIAVLPKEKGVTAPPSIPGICGIADSSALPGYWGIEAGQSAVGDLLNWFVNYVCEGDDTTHATLTKLAERLLPGETGLLALDWNNGNRTILVDARLTGLILGQTLRTTRAEIYRALIEATAFGAHTIQLRLQESGIQLDRIVACGGIARKNPFFMQTYADVSGHAIEVTEASETCALGAAIFAAVAAGSEAGGYDETGEAQTKMASRIATIYQPDPERHAVYAELYTLYRRLHDSFGVAGHNDSLADVMKSLLAIQHRASAKGERHSA